MYFTRSRERGCVAVCYRLNASSLTLEMELPSQPVYVMIPSPNESIESDRLVLRPIRDSDALALLAIRSRPEVAKTK